MEEHFLIKSAVTYQVRLGDGLRDYHRGRSKSTHPTLPYCTVEKGEKWLLKNDVTYVTYQVRLGGGYPPREVKVNSWGLNSPTAAPSLPAAIKPVTRGTPGRPTQGKQNLSYEDGNGQYSIRSK